MLRLFAVTLTALILIGAGGILYAFLPRSPEPQAQRFRPDPELVDSTCEVWRELPEDQRGTPPEKCASPSKRGAAR